MIWITEVDHLDVRILSIMEWKQIDTAPFDRDLELAVIAGKETWVVAFPCRRLTDDGWLDVETNKQVHYIRATHWRDWFRN